MPLRTREAANLSWVMEKRYAEAPFRQSEGLTAHRKSPAKHIRLEQPV